MAYKYRKLQYELSKRLRDHEYSFEELVNIVGCGSKTMNRYVYGGIVKAKSSGSNKNSRYFDNEQLERACFVYDCQKALKAPPALSAAFYDYCKYKRIRIDLQNIIDRVEDYRTYGDDR